MKIEIDLNEILGDEYGSESLQESVRRQIVDALSASLKDGISKQIKDETSRVLNEELSKAVTEKMPGLVDDLMNAEYTPVDRYGSRSKPTTFRAEMIRSINEQMIYKKATYDSEKNAFSKSVDALVDQKMNEFRSAFFREVDAKFVAEAMQFATTRLSERLGAKK